MKNVLFILHEYHPNASAITNCLDSIIEEMAKNKINITIITRRINFETAKIFKDNNITVYRINDYINLFLNKVKETKGIKNVFYRILLKIVYIYKGKIKKDTEGYFNIKKTTTYINKIFKKNKYDTIISVSWPFKTHIIAKNIKLKYPNIVWIAYQFDPHAYNYTINGNIEFRIQEETENLKYADKIFLPENNYQENLKTDLKVLKEKYCPIEFALVKESNLNITSPCSKKIIFAYAGTFYENIRTPYNMFKFFEHIDFDYEINLYYITEINEKIFQEYKNIFKDKINLYKGKSKEECNSALAKANIIINIGNEITNQIPSKCYELISLGKPIVNFYSIENDTSKQIFSKYPLVLNISKDFDENDIKKFIDFCMSNKNKILSFQKATANYQKANEVAKKFIKEVNKCHGN